MKKIKIKVKKKSGQSGCPAQVGVCVYYWADFCSGRKNSLVSNHKNRNNKKFLEK